MDGTAPIATSERKLMKSRPIRLLPGPIIPGGGVVTLGGVVAI